MMLSWYVLMIQYLNIFDAFFSPFWQKKSRHKVTNPSQALIARLWRWKVGWLDILRLCSFEAMQSWRTCHWSTSWWFFTNPSEKYGNRQIGFIFPNFRGEHEKYLSLPPPSHEPSTVLWWKREGFLLVFLVGIKYWHFRALHMAWAFACWGITFCWGRGSQKRDQNGS